jgi:hypothetical protein
MNLPIIENSSEVVGTARSQVVVARVAAEARRL